VVEARQGDGAEEGDDPGAAPPIGGGAPERRGMPSATTIRNRLLAVIAVVLVIALLRWSYPVSMPLAAATFVVAAAWPIKPWLDRLLPAGLSYAGTALALLLVLAGFFAAIYFSIVQVVHAFVVREDQFRALYNTYSAWSGANGLPGLTGETGYERLVAVAQAVLGRLYTVLGYLGLIAVLVLLSLPEVPALRRKLRSVLDGEDRREMLDTVERIAGLFRSYVGVTMVTSLLTGAVSAGWAYVVGLDLALTWGVLNFLLNFIPVVGNIIGIIPPSLYAFLQFEEWRMPVVVFLGYALLQMVISNFVYPWLQGQSLSLSPVAVVVALTFWGWLWGAAGALLAVPLTAGVAIACGHFRSTTWIARLLAGEPHKGKDDTGKGGPRR